jgi:hypothetical protein
MAYASNPPRIKWDRPGHFQGVTVERELDGGWYAWRFPYNGLVSQAVAAELLGVSLMTINNWVNARKLGHIKAPGQPSVIPLAEIKRVRNAIADEQRPRGGHQR